MGCVDRYGLPLTGGVEAVAAYNRGVGNLLRLEEGALHAVAAAVALDPTFALGHAALALLGHELCAPVDIEARLRDARLHARRSTERERSHVEAVARHVGGDSGPLVRHLRRHPTDALLLSVAVPTIAFAGVTTVPRDAWEIVERCAPAYGDDWWFTGLLAFMRQEQGRFDEAMELSCLSLDVEPGAGHSAHARAHAHYETGDHTGGLAWMDGWITGAGAQADSLCHFSWHAAMHELSMGDLDAVRLRYDAQLRPQPGLGCRNLVDSGSLLWRWALTPGSTAVPRIEEVLAVVDSALLASPQSPFMAMHAAVVLCAAEDAEGLATLARSCAARTDPTHVEVTAPLARALRRLVLGDPSGAADAIAALAPQLGRVGGSDAQREVVEETRICALVKAGRYPEALTVIDGRLDRRRCRRDEWFQAQAQLTEIWSPSTARFFDASGA
ncbi:pyridine nucleotide-disulfide oxidoreductase [Nocardioides panacis]|uniref:Pyridine nucleotide-disulfide oxidoreductase n=1 Tax=Nocardioides panacis TaxID=2849501 RepID=A0A975Y1I9_9ACTN|nr:pyridine nucleotide-disulfide oxidoreductase [Nocardioides panacis]